MAELTVKQLIAPVSTVIFIIVAFLAVDNRYAKAADVEAAIIAMAADVKAAEKSAKLYTASGVWSDLVGREAMYRAKSDAGSITEGERSRWRDVQQLVANARAEMNKLSQ